MRCFCFALAYVIALTTAEACSSNFKLHFTGDDQFTAYVSRASGTSIQLGGNPTDTAWLYVDSHADFDSVSLSAGDVLSFYYYNKGGPSGMLGRIVETSGSSPAQFVTGTANWVCAGTGSGVAAHTPTRWGGNLAWTYQNYNAVASGFTPAVQYAKNVAGQSPPWGLVGTPSQIGPDAYWIGATSSTQGSNVLHGFCRFTVPAFSCSGGSGDPVFAGFQGQEFQFHGLADEYFNLVSSPLIQLNAHFVYLSSGNCMYNDTACFTHPGTYMDILGFSIGGQNNIKIQAGSHEMGLRIWIGDREHSLSNSYSVLAIANTSYVATVQHDDNRHVRIKTPLMDFEIINSDYFFNFKLALHDSNALRIGSTPQHISTKEFCASEHAHVPNSIEKAVSALYPLHLPLHGLVGQTWRNVRVCSKDWIGVVEDYVVSNLFGTDYQYNHYLTDIKTSSNDDGSIMGQ